MNKNRTVWKFPLAVTSTQTLEMPAGARILAVQRQGDQVCIWALCDPYAGPQKRVIIIVGTGHEAPISGVLTHLGTFQLEGGALVFHAFEMTDDICGI